MPPVGTMEILVILLAVILFGPKRIPEIARTMSSALRQLRTASDDLMRELTREVDLEERPPPRKPPGTGERPPHVPQLVEKPPSEAVNPLTHEQIVEAAGKLGLKVDGKTDDDLRAEIVSRIHLDKPDPYGLKEKAG